MPKISLNLAESYVPEWSTWEVAREIICNAMDAGDYGVETPTSDTLIVKTAAEPSFAELMVIGASTKRNDDSKIGQFGEGFKLATLVAIRNGGSVEVFTSEGRLTFSLEETTGLADRVLHATLNRRFSRPGCAVTVKLPGIASIIDGRFSGAAEGPIRRDFIEKAKIFSKGVFICALAQESISDWNIPIKLNRDRAVVDAYDVKCEIARFFGRGAATVEDFEKMLKAPQTLEHSSMSYLWSHNIHEEGRLAAKEAWLMAFGEKAVIASSNETINQLAYGKGFLPKAVERKLSEFGLPSADDVVQTSDTFDEVVVEDNILEECHKALDVMDIPATVAFFADHAEAPLGKATWEDGICIAWLNERLAKPGSRTLRLSTLAHELCHVDSRSCDGSIKFEYDLTMIVGKLLAKLL